MGYSFVIGMQSHRVSRCGHKSIHNGVSFECSQGQTVGVITKVFIWDIHLLLECSQGQTVGVATKVFIMGIYNIHLLLECNLTGLVGVVHNGFILKQKHWLVFTLAKAQKHAYGPE